MSLRSRLLACGVLASVLAIPSVSFGQCQKGQNGGGPGGSPGTFYGPRMSFNAQPRPSQMQIYQLMQQRQTHLLLQQMVQQEIARQQYLVALQQQQILQNLMIHSNARLQHAEPKPRWYSKIP